MNKVLFADFFTSHLANNISYFSQKLYTIIPLHILTPTSVKLFKKKNKMPLKSNINL